MNTADVIKHYNYVQWNLYWQFSYASFPNKYNYGSCDAPSKCCLT